MLAERMTALSGCGTAKARAAAQAEKTAGQQIIDLSAGEIWCDPPRTLRAGAMAAIEGGIGRYTDTIGLEALRRAIARTLSKQTAQIWDAEEVAVTAGGKQALFNAAMAILGPGDEVIIPVPYWTTFPAQALLAGARPVLVDTRATGYVPRPEDLEKATTPATKAIVVNTPNNPTGTVYDRATLQRIAAFAIDHGLWVIFDECYGAFAAHPHRHHTIVSVVPEVRSRTLVIGAFSKQYAITGWRLGYLAAPAAVIAAVRSLQSHTTSNPNVIAQHAVLALLKAGDGEFIDGLRARLGRARALCLEILAGLKSVPAPPAQGGFYLYLDLAGLLAGRAPADLIGNADDVATLLLREAGVAGVPGTAFGDPTGLRLSYGVPMDPLQKGLERIVATLNALSPAPRTAPHPSVA